MPKAKQRVKQPERKIGGTFTKPSQADADRRKTRTVATEFKRLNIHAI